MKTRIPVKMHPLPKDEEAINSARELAGGNKVNKADLGDEIGSESHKKQSNRLFTGKSKAGKNSPFLPGEVGMSDSGAGGDPGRVNGGPIPHTGEDLGEVIDQSGKRAPYGRPGTGWADESGKLGDLDPQETDQPSWVNTWSSLNTGPYGAGVTIDENYGVERPRTQSRQEERFRQCNPEFQDVADDGDWTSSKWTSNI